MRDRLVAAWRRSTLREGEREALLRSLQALRGGMRRSRYDRAQMLANLAAAARGIHAGGFVSIKLTWSAMCWVPGPGTAVGVLHLDRMSEGRHGMVSSVTRAKAQPFRRWLNTEITDLDGRAA